MKDKEQTPLTPHRMGEGIRAFINLDDLQHIFTTLDDYSTRRSGHTLPTTRTRRSYSLAPSDGERVGVRGCLIGSPLKFSRIPLGNSNATKV
jgi:hypothetical protein